MHKPHLKRHGDSWVFCIHHCFDFLIFFFCDTPEFISDLYNAMAERRECIERDIFSEKKFHEHYTNNAKYDIIYWDIIDDNN